MTLNDQDDFVEMLEELAPLLAELPRGVSQEILGSLTGISRLLRDLDVARSELERRVAIIEAEQIVASEERDS